MPGFLDNYKKIVLGSRIDVVQRAYARALDERPGPGVEAARCLHESAVRALRDMASGRVLGHLYGPEHLLVLVHLCRDGPPRFRDGYPPELEKVAKTAKVAWRELRDMLCKALPGQFDASLPRAHWRPLFSHLARELIFWAYFAHLEATREAGGDAARIFDAASPALLEALLDQLKVDLDLSKVSTHVSLPPDIESVPDEIACGPFESTYDYADAARLRYVISAMQEHELGSSTEGGGKLAAFHFSDRLLLRFAYTGRTHLDRATPPGELAQIRAALIAALLALGFKPAVDIDCGDALGWLRTVNDRRQHFGASFDDYFSSALDRALASYPDSQLPDCLATFVNVAEDCRRELPHLRTSAWIAKHVNARLPVGVQAARYSEEHLASEIRDALAADLAAMIGSKALAAGKLTFEEALDLVRDSDLTPELSVTCELLFDVRAAYNELRIYAALEDKVPLRIKKYFTALCRGREMGADAKGVMRVDEWRRATEDLCRDAAGFIEHYRSVWARLRSVPVSQGSAIESLAALYPWLAPLTEYAES